MPKQRSDSELLREGCRSYHTALFAVMQFRREVQEAIRAAVEDRIDEIAEALQLGKAEISDGLTPYADPVNFQQTWDGSEAEIGLKYPGRDWEAKWGIYFLFWIGEGAEGLACVSCWIKEPGLAVERIVSLGCESMETDGSTVWLSEPVGEGSFRDAMDRALAIWIDVWRKAGGLHQYRPLTAPGSSSE